MHACRFAYVLVFYHQVICTVNLSTQSHSYIISQQLADSCCLVGFCQLMLSLELLAKRYKGRGICFYGRWCYMSGQLLPDISAEFSVLDIMGINYPVICCHILEV